MVFLLNPIPRSRRESARTEGNETPVRELTTGSEESATESEPHRGTDRLANKKFSASWRKWCFGFVASLDKTATAAAPAAAAAAAKVTKAVVVVALKGREVAEEEEGG